MVTPWVYDHKYLDADFNYEDLETKYVNQTAGNNAQPQVLKEQLDQAHRI